MLGNLVSEAIGKYVHPTRYLQVIETGSNQTLTAEERQWITDAILREASDQSSTDGEDDDIFLTPNTFRSPEGQKDGRQDTSLFTLQETDNELKKENAKSYVRHRVTFTTTKDMDSAKGMKNGEWTKMLRDHTFKFQCTCTADKLKKRTDSKTFKCKFDKYDVQWNLSVVRNGQAKSHFMRNTAIRYQQKRFQNVFFIKVMLMYFSA